MRVDSRTLRRDLSLTDLYELINTLPIGYHGFAVMSNMYAAAYGVINQSKDGAGEAVTPLNNCGREKLWAGLVGVQQDTERELGYNLSSRYHKEKINLKKSPFLVLEWPGLDAVNVRPGWVLAGANRPVEFRAMTGVLGVPIGGNRYTVTLDGGRIENPHEVIIRNSVNGLSYRYDENGTTYPRLVGGNWVVLLNTAVDAYNGTDALDVYHRSYAYVTVTLPVGAVVSDYYLTYPGTDQIVPTHSVFATGGSNEYTYIVYSYALPTPAFSNDTIHLNQNQYYKLYQTLDLKKRTQVTINAVVTRSCPGVGSFETDTVGVGISIYNAALSIIQLNSPDLDSLLNLCDLFPLDTNYCDENSTSYSLTIYYHTTPNLLRDSHLNTIENAIRAVMAKVAAELPTKACGCDSEIGFIGAQQATYFKTRDVFGGVITSVDFGAMHGQFIYNQLMAVAPRYRVPINIPINL